VQPVDDWGAGRTQFVTMIDQQAQRHGGVIDLYLPQTFGAQNAARDRGRVASADPRQ